jgi:hypothetical protein
MTSCRHRMLARVFIQAALVGFAAMPCAQAGVETINPIDSIDSNAPDPMSERAVVANRETSKPTVDGALDSGGAIFSPFVAAPANSARRETQEASSPGFDGGDFTFGAITALVGFAAFAYVVRRARN